LLVPFLPDTAGKIHKVFETGRIVPLDGVLFPKIYKHTPNPNTPNEAIGQTKSDENS